LEAAAAVAAAADTSGGGCGRRGAAATTATRRSARGCGRLGADVDRRRLRPGPLGLPEPGLAAGGWRGQVLAVVQSAGGGRACPPLPLAVSSSHGLEWLGAGLAAFRAMAEVICWGHSLLSSSLLLLRRRCHGGGAGGLAGACRWLRGGVSGCAGHLPVGRLRKQLGACYCCNWTCADWPGAHPGESLH
jgi:hypothetical protein